MFLTIVGIATLVSMIPFATKSVTVKLLPFDNKSELQVVFDLPEGTSLEDTDRTLAKAASLIADVPELANLQAYSGTAAPFNFNGLVRHYFLRSAANQGDLQVNLTPKAQRSRQSHQIALEIRHRLDQGLKLPPGSSVKVVEVPPGPPVLSTLLLEVYGRDAAERREVTAKVREAFGRVPFIVDVDDTVREPGERIRFRLNEAALEWYGVTEQAVYDTMRAVLSGGAGRLQPSRRRRLADRDRGAPAEVRTRRHRTSPVDAGIPRRQGQRRARRSRPRRARERPRPRSSAATAARPRWSPPNSPVPTRRRSTACSPSPTS